MRTSITQLHLPLFLGALCDECADRFTVERMPFLLDCGHSICSLCVNNRGVTNAYKCVTCSSVTNIPEGSTLPMNLTLSNLITNISTCISTRRSSNYMQLLSVRSATQGSRSKDYAVPRRACSLSYTFPREESCSSPHSDRSLIKFSHFDGSKCPVCQKVFSENRVPRLLMCFHTFCESCLIKAMKDDSIICPKCNYASEIPEQGVQGLIRNFAVQSYSRNEVELDLIKLTANSIAEQMGVVCPVCQETFLSSPPRLLKCGHSICYTCVKNIYFRSQKGNVKCPECRCLMRLGDMGLHAIPINHAVAILLQEWCRLLNDPQNVYLSRASTIPILRVNEEFREELEEEVKHMYFDKRKSVISETTYVPSEEPNIWEDHLGDVNDGYLPGMIREMLQMRAATTSMLNELHINNNEILTSQNRLPELHVFTRTHPSCGFQSGNWLFCMLAVVCLMCATMIGAMWWAFSKK